MSVSYLSRPVWDFNRDWVSCDAVIGSRSFRCNVSADFLTGGQFRPVKEEEAMRLFEHHKYVIEDQWITAPRNAGARDNQITVTSAGTRSIRYVRK